MVSPEDIKKLADLSRLSVSPEEVTDFAKDIDAVLGYVGQITKISDLEVKKDRPSLRNVLREDAHPHESGLYTEAILKEAPSREGGYLKVKKILSHD
jgi:aspartyl-tRNA(Asn)/glutamyl-tRNA(Gln) amidotransferase subunit C